VHESLGQVHGKRACRHCLAHDGVKLPFELP